MHSPDFSAFGQRQDEPVITNVMSRALADTEILSLAAGFTANETLPADLVEKAVHHLAQARRNPESLQYGPNQGRPLLREAIARHLAAFEGNEHSIFSPENICVSNGAQQALYHLVQILCEPGDLVLVENPTYFVFLDVLRGFGVRAVSVPTKMDGEVDFTALENLLERWKKSGKVKRLKMLYLVSYFSNPSSRSLSRETKTEYGRLFRKLGLLPRIIEDAAYRELFLEDPWPCPSIFSIDSFESFDKIYLGTFDKSLASGLKVGFSLTNDEDLLKRMLFAKGREDFGTSNFTQAVIEWILSEGHWPQFLARLRKGYAEKAACAEDALQASALASLGWKWKKPAGGLYFWLRGPEGFDTSLHSPFFEECAQRKVLYVPGDLCIAEGAPRQFVRLSYASLKKNLLPEAISRFAAAAERASEAGK